MQGMQTLSWIHAEGCGSAARAGNRVELSSRSELGKFIMLEVDLHVERFKA